jgi:two-component system chemotaxis response regulator CheY
MSLNILIVDDSATTRALIKRTIKLTGLPVTQFYEAENGKSGLEMLDCVKVDLVLADLNMPEMNGFEMTRQMLQKDSTRHIPVVVVSAEPNAKVFAQNHESIRGCVSKPFTPEGIRNTINEVLGVSHV